MAFSMSRIRASVYDYKSALTYWNACKPWRGESGELTRPLIGPRRRTMSVNMHADGSIAFQLHRTEAVTYTPDDKLILRIYESRSTTAFAQSFTPNRALPFMTSGVLSVTCYGTGTDRAQQRRFYSTSHGDVITIDLNTDEVTGAAPWSRYIMDRKRANAIRKESRIAEVKLFVRAADTLGAPVPEGSRWPWDMHEAAKVLADQSRWSEFRALSGRSALAQLEAMLLRDGGALVTPEPEPYLHDWMQIVAYDRAWKAYGKP
jgi:hypothetical protein